MAKLARYSPRGILCVWLLLAACGPPAAPPPAPGTSEAPTASQARPPVAQITVGYGSATGYHLPMWVAQEAGLYARNGLDVDLRLTPATAGMAALLAGELQMTTGAGELLNATVGGADLVVLANLSPVSPWKFMVSTSIRTKEDFIGKRVAVTRIGSSTDAGTRVGLRLIGLDPARDVTFVQTADLTAALLGGAADGALRSPPETIRLEAQGYHALFDLAALGAPAADLVIVAGRPWVSGHREVVQRYIDSLVQAIALQKTDKAVAFAALRKYMKLEDEAELEGTWQVFVQSVFPRVPYPRPEHFANTLAALGEHQEELRGFDVNQVIDASFLRSAEERGLAGP